MISFVYSVFVFFHLKSFCQPLTKNHIMNIQQSRLRVLGYQFFPASSSLFIIFTVHFCMICCWIFSIGPSKQGRSQPTRPEEHFSLSHPLTTIVCFSVFFHNFSSNICHNLDHRVHALHGDRLFGQSHYALG